MATPARCETQAILFAGVVTHCDFLQDIERARAVLNLPPECQRLLVDAGKAHWEVSPESLCKEEEKLPDFFQGNVQALIHDEGSSPALEKTLRELPPSEGPRLLYFTDHGGNTGRKGTSVTASQNSISHPFDAEELARILKNAPSAHPTLLVIDHCFSGGMLDALFTQSTEATLPQVCGVAAASKYEFAYTGKSIMNFAQKLLSDPKLAHQYDSDKNQRLSLHDVMHYYRMLPTLPRKDGEITVKSTPVTTSDLFLERYLTARLHPEAKTPPAPCSPNIEKDSSTHLQETLPPIRHHLWKENLAKRKLEIQQEALAHFKGCTGASSYFETQGKGQNLRLSARRGGASARFAQAVQKSEAEISARFNEQLLVTLAERSAKMQIAFRLLGQSGDLGNFPEKELNQACQMGITPECHRMTKIFSHVYENLKTTPSLQGTEDDKKLKALGDQWDEVSERLEKASISSRECRLLNDSIHASQALDTLMQGQDPLAIDQYLALLNCEKTPITRNYVPK